MRTLPLRESLAFSVLQVRRIAYVLIFWCHQSHGTHKPSVPLVQQDCNCQAGASLGEDSISAVSTSSVSQDVSEASPVNLQTYAATRGQGHARLWGRASGLGMMGCPLSLRLYSQRKMSSSAKCHAAVTGCKQYFRRKITKLFVCVWEEKPKIDVVDFIFLIK